MAKKDERVDEIRGVSIPGIRTICVRPFPHLKDDIDVKPNRGLPHPKFGRWHDLE